ncbi:MAG: hypothetical protein EXR79_09270 [Myxococcales bacterium]|nr:hypothetical protein [Myxococcales bacterium]
MNAAARDRFAFLGREFLTWLWFEAETNKGAVDTPTFGPVRVDFGQRLTLETGGNVREGSTIQAEMPLLVEESRVALRTGKKVARARLVLEVGERTFQFGLDAESLTLAQVKLPTVLSTEDAPRVDERLLLLDELEAMVDEMYARFVRLRSDAKAWGPVRDEMRRWVAAPAPA